MNQEALIRTVEVQMGRKPVKMSDRFMEDLDAESIDFIHLMVSIEEQTGLFIPEEVIPEFKTVQDLYNFMIAHQSE
jgi:acyl carrier protein